MYSNATARINQRRISTIVSDSIAERKFVGDFCRNEEEKKEETYLHGSLQVLTLYLVDAETGVPA